jgi:hypothetical protein
VTARRLRARATIAEIATALREDGLATYAREAYGRAGDLPRCAPHERPDAEAWRSARRIALRRMARDVQRAHRNGALLWTSDRLATTDASRIDVRLDDADEAVS